MSMSRSPTPGLIVVGFWVVVGFSVVGFTVVGFAVVGFTVVGGSVVRVGLVGLVLAGVLSRSRSNFPTKLSHNPHDSGHVYLAMKSPHIPLPTYWSWQPLLSTMSWQLASAITLHTPHVSAHSSIDNTF